MKRFFCFFLFCFVGFTSGFAQNEFEVGIEVKDKYTKRILIPIISVLAPNSPTELAGQMNYDRYIISVKPDINYLIVIAFQEYKTYRQTHTFTKSTTNDRTLLTIELEPLVPPKNAAPIPQKPQEPSKPIQTAPATVVSAPSKQELTFQAVDALTGKPIAAEFMLTNDLKESYSGTTRETNATFSARVPLQPRPYTLTVSANGYQNHTSKLTVSAPLAEKQPVQIIKLSKGDIVLRIKVLEEQTGKPIPATLRIVSENDNRELFNQKNSFNGQIPISLNPNGRYMIEAEAKGYMPFRKELEKAVEKLSETTPLTIRLSKIGDIFLNLSAVNASSGQRVAATFKITASLTGQVTQLKSALPVKHKIVEPDIYQIETIAPGFAPLKGEIDAEEIGVGQVFNYEAKLVPTTKQPTTNAPLETFRFAILDGQSQKPVPNARLKIINEATQKVIPTKPAGQLKETRLKTDQTYLIEVEAKGYEKTTMKMAAAEWANRGEFLTNISLVPLVKTTAAPATRVINEKIFDNIKAGQSVSIEDNIYFDQSSYILRTEAYGQLLRLAAVMTKNPDINIEIIGHTDNVGDARLNKILSEQRAKVIANFLGNEGINESRLIYRGEGSTKPIAPNDTDENRRRNRRVQFLVK
ncbi:OmpA family protein [Runella salmonicolor]|uniref:OmpA family protein n=1 Tax=Runella salmonicolor TaxID=2950278 RepID=A0ABT1FTE2_9BACT|nr:OmpA family protein [Runella salmonicolor]MCP1383898.1 OmpA family protein [Runella salmonicolor]